MDVTSDIREMMDTPAREITVEGMQQDFEYEIAQKITKSLFEQGLISDEEQGRITRLNKESFSPLYKELIEI
ncbi:SHOCT domain-containing protein [Butyrivibrio sp. AD3002]|uniref:SHOCT domain-containing protein n=1 Tax=Butyrivibrio sp. AD3002 TaxID=1280670 RepID=UPI0003B53769|nr:SHOCT domain-containing protein [Butyrivibrio sp. AD3002]